MSDEPASKRRRVERDDDDSNNFETSDDGPACHSCRKRKAKCSRQQPCAQCIRLNIECLYDDKKMRPGMKAGAIEALTKRISTLEQMFLGQGMLLMPFIERALSESNTHELSLGDQVDKLKASYIKLSEATPDWQQCAEEVRKIDENHAKRPLPQITQVAAAPVDPASTDASILPPREVVDALVDWYFQHIHPWIPILHIRRFREDLETANRSNLEIILYAIVSLCLRFDQTSSLTHAEKKELSLKCRHVVILQSMEKFSVAGLQALVIIAFDIIGSGRGPSAWSVIGSMTRTVEQLRLSVEDRDARPAKHAPREYLIRRMSFLPESSNWIESEERRRVFWNVFLMDRFCSVATGWNNSLTGADVRRRLPCEGAIWLAGTPVRTPYFGIAERSSPSQQVLTPASERHPVDEEEVEAIGGFAFFVEATESLNLVTTFFLQHAVDFSDPQDMQMCLMRFKELDLRLVKWRLFLPPKWRNASVLNQDSIIDPNLTLAHITHNTAVIQLHQCVAYPSASWRASPVTLPSLNSSETCMAAACEISTIAQQFLQLSPSITNPQFSFCLFIAARVFLAHAKYNGTELHRAFNDIVLSLKKIARGWTGRDDESQVDGPREEEEENLASKFVTRLEQGRNGVGLKQFSGRDPTLDIRQPVYSDEIDTSRANSVTPMIQTPRMRPSGDDAVLIGEDSGQNECSPDSITLAFPPLPVSFESFQDHSILNSGVSVTEFAGDANMHGQTGFDVDLDGIFDDQYQHMLRISTFSSHQ